MSCSDASENLENIAEFFNIGSFVNLEAVTKINLFVKNMSEYTKSMIVKKNIEQLFIFIPVLEYISCNTNIILSILFVICLFYYCFILYIFHYMILIDSFILSFILLQDCSAKKNSRRLAKNVISLFFSSNSCSIFNVAITFLLYFEVSKRISKFILKIIRIFTMLLATYIPFLYSVYPTCKNLSFIEENSCSEES
jgi:hypothetical protein